MTSHRRFIGQSVVFVLVALPCWAVSVARGPVPIAQAAEVPAPNPPIAKACGIDVSLVLDASGSVQSAHAVDDVRDAASAMLDSLKDTGSTARVLQFATLAQELAPRQLVDDVSMGNNGQLDQAVDGYFNPQPQRPSNVSIYSLRANGNPGAEGSWNTSNNSIQYTNWQQALDRTATDTAELVVFITDGDPTAYDFDRPGDPFDQGPPPDVGVGTDGSNVSRELTLDRSIVAANSVKALGSRVLAIGVGQALQNQASVNRLTQVSGPNIARNSAEFDIQTTDVALIRDFDALADEMRALVLELCSPSLTIRKFAQSSTSATYAPAPGWDITATPTVPGGSFAWVLPPGASGASATLSTDANGFAQFQWEPNPADLSSRAVVSEAIRQGWIAGRPGIDNDFHCEFKDTDGNVRVIDDDLTVVGGNATFTLDPIGAEIGTCSVWNSFDYQPAIALTKANSPTSVRGDLVPPAIVTSTYVATNPGTTPLVGITVEDNKCGPVGPVLAGPVNVGDLNSNSRLEPGEAWQFTCDREAETSQGPPGGVTVVNTATVHGTDPNGEVVTATAVDDVTAFVPEIQLTKLVNGLSEVTVVTGADVTYTYAVTNAGNTPLGTPTLVDDTPPCVSPTRGLDNPGNNDATLDIGETWTYSCLSAGVAAPVINTATVTATPLDPLNGNAPFAGTNPPVSDSDAASVITVEPGLRLTKVVDEPLVFPGTTVNYAYTAVNTGTADLRNDTGNAGWVTDNRCASVNQVLAGLNNAGDLNTDDLINPGETWQFRCATAISVRTINIATISAQPVDGAGDPVGAPLVRRARALVEVVQPGIDLIKTALVPVVLDADANPIAGPDVPTPQPAQYTYDVANTGVTPLGAVTLTDDRCATVTFVSGDTNTDNVLDIDEVWSYTCTTALGREQATPPPVAESGFVTNTATVVATPFLPGDPASTAPNVSDSDIAQVLVIEPGLQLTKTASAAVVRADDDVTYTVAVTNTGDVGLRLVGPTDAKCPTLTLVGGDTNNNGLLDGANSAAPETWTYTCTRPIPAQAPGEFDINSASVIGIDPLGNVYSAEDTEQVRVIDPGITLVKTVNQDLVPAGTAVTYSFDVTNSGTSALAADDVLANVVLGDVSIPAMPSCATPALISKTGGNQDAFLDRVPAETWHYQCSAVITAATNNVGLVGALGGTSFGLSLVVAAPGRAFVEAFHPGIEITKTAAPTTLVGGGTVVYTYSVRNTGDVPLSGVQQRISDNTCPGVTYVSGDQDVDGLLDTVNSIFEDALDETWTFTCATVVSQTTTNVVAVQGSPTDPQGSPLCGTQQVPGPCDATSRALATVEVLPVPIETAPPTSVDSGAGLPGTGSSSSLPMAWTASIALCVGIALILLTRRRSRHTT